MKSFLSYLARIVNSQSKTVTNDPSNEIDNDRGSPDGQAPNDHDDDKNGPTTPTCGSTGVNPTNESATMPCQVQTTMMDDGEQSLEGLHATKEEAAGGCQEGNIDATWDCPRVHVASGRSEDDDGEMVRHDDVNQGSDHKRPFHSNKKRKKPKSSKYRGVTLVASIQSAKPWKAYVYVHGVPKHADMFAAEEEAARGHDKMARTYLGDKAILNFPDEGDERVDYDEGKAMSPVHKKPKTTKAARYGSCGSVWVAQIAEGEGERPKYVGCFATREEAARARERVLYMQGKKDKECEAMLNECPLPFSRHPTQGRVDSPSSDHGVSAKGEESGAQGGAGFDEGAGRRKGIRTKRPKSSPYRGVSFVKSREHLPTPWTAHITTNGKPKHLGCFRTEDDAARAFDKAARTYPKYKDKLNFPDECEDGSGGAVIGWDGGWDFYDERDLVQPPCYCFDIDGDEEEQQGEGIAMLTESSTASEEGGTGGGGTNPTGSMSDPFCDMDHQDNDCEMIEALDRAYGCYVSTDYYYSSMEKQKGSLPDLPKDDYQQ